MPTGTIKAIFFDLDGTIVDTEPVAAMVLSQFYLEQGVKLSAEDSQYTNGKKWAVALDYLFEKHLVNLPKAQIGDQILERYQKELKKNLPVVKGSVAAIQEFAREYPMAVISGSHRRDVIFALETLRVKHHFKMILGAEDYLQSKPSPEGYLKAIAQMKLNPAEVVVFEDSDVGIASAKAAGTKAVAITGTNHFGQKFLQADLKIVDFNGINTTWLRAQF